MGFNKFKNNNFVHTAREYFYFKVINTTILLIRHEVKKFLITHEDVRQELSILYSSD